MTARAAFVLGFCLVAAALVHGGLYSAGHDFVMNRFTGDFQFVPADDVDEDATLPTHRTVAYRCRALTSAGPDARFVALHRRR